MEARLWLPGASAADALPRIREALEARGWRVLEAGAPHRLRLARTRRRGLYQGAEQNATLDLLQDGERLLLNLRLDPVSGTFLQADLREAKEDLEAVEARLRGLR